MSGNETNLKSIEKFWFPDNEYGKILSKLWYMAQNSSNTSKKKWEVLEEIKVLSYGVFGLQNRIFGKFFVSFHLTTFGNTSNVDEILGNSMISDH